MNEYALTKKNYCKLKNSNIHFGGNKKCVLEDDDNVVFGNGGSTAIIVITSDKKVYKFFTMYDFLLDIELDVKIKNKNKGALNEIKIYELITTKIIDEKISPHFVKYLGHHECSDAKTLFKYCPNSYVEFMKLANFQKTTMCEKYFRNYPDVKINNEFKVLEIEYCDYSCADFIRDVSKLPEIEMEKYLDIFFFQIIHAIVSVQKYFPYFIHGDLFMRNILGLREKDNTNYRVYKFNNKKYFVPQKIFFPKINDFGLTNLNNELKNVKPDIIIVRYWLPFMGPCLGTILRIVKKNHHTKIVCIADNIIPHEKRPGDAAFTNYFIKPIDAFVTMSEKVLSELKILTPKPAQQVTHPLYDNFGEQMNKLEARQFLKLDPLKKVVLFFGFIRN